MASKNRRKEITLPKTLPDFYNAFSGNSLGGILRQCASYWTLSPTQFQIWKYSQGALQAGRPLDSFIIFMAGSSGSGKSTTINVLFDDPKLCSTSSSSSETREPVLLKKRLRVSLPSSSRHQNLPTVVGYLGIVDVPGTFDTDADKEERNQSSIKQFKHAMVEFESRARHAKAVPWRYFQMRATVYPNIILFTVKVPDNRMLGNDSFIRKSLIAFKNQGGLIDMRYCNLIVVLTHVMQLPHRTPQIFRNKLQEQIDNVRTVVYEVLTIPRVEVVPVENCGEDYDEKEGDFFRLPTGELSHKNLFDAMTRLFNKNHDLLGKLMMTWYFRPESPEKKEKTEIVRFQLNGEPSKQGIPLEQNLTELDFKELETSIKAGDLVPHFNFHSLGYGYCPVTEEVRPVRLLKQDGHGGESQGKVVHVDNSKFLVPSCVNTFISKTSRFHRVTFLNKEEYQSHMRASYGIEADFKLVVKTGSTGRWISSSSDSVESTVVSMIHEMQVATFKLDNPNEQLHSEQFYQDLSLLPAEYTAETGRTFLSFFSRWGSHIVIEESVGGSVQLDCTLERAAVTKEKLQEVEAHVSSLFGGLGGTARFNSQSSAKSLREVGVSNEHLRIDGGDPPKLISLQTLDTEVLEQWSKTVSQCPTGLPRSIKLYPYYNFAPSGPRYNSFRQATADYLNGTLTSRSSDTDVSRQGLSDEGLAQTEEATPEKNCFPCGTPVYLASGQTKPIESLTKADVIRSKGIQFTGKAMRLRGDKVTSFCTFLDWKPNAQVEYLVFTFSNMKQLIVSPAHMIFEYIPDCNRVKGKQAKRFKIGEAAVYCQMGKEGIEAPRILGITTELLTGAFSPLTSSGTFFANGFMVSSYANTDHFAVAQAALFPLKMWSILKWSKPSKKSFAGSNPEKDSDISPQGLHPYAKCLINLRKSLTAVLFK